MSKYTPVIVLVDDILVLGLKILASENLTPSMNLLDNDEMTFQFKRNSL
jgi:hypothetical protein